MPTDAITVWQNCLGLIRKHIPSQSFETWFLPIRPAQLKDKVLTIQVPSRFHYEWLEEHYVAILKQAILQELGKEGKLNYSVVVNGGTPYRNSIARPRRIPPVAGGELPAPENGKITQSGRKDAEIESNLLDNYDFSNFIEGDCNRLARSTGYAVAQNPGITAFNPLFIYGGSGLGKTHLANAIGNTIKQNFTDKRVLYTNGDRFVKEFVNAIKTNQTQKFTDRYLGLDVLIVDDIQFLAGKDKTQENFFHIFNHLHQARKQIVMTSDRSPGELKGLHDRLLSRFRWGLSADMQIPDYETRIAIIQTKLEQEERTLPEDVIYFIAKNVDTNVRELEGVVISLIAKAEILKKPLNVELAAQTMQHVVKTEGRIEIGIEEIQQTVANYFGLTPEDLVSRSRKKDIVTARQIAMFLALRYTNEPLKAIGAHFGGRDHTTVIHARKVVPEKAEKDPSFSSFLEQIKQLIDQMI